VICITKDIEYVNKSRRGDILAFSALVKKYSNAVCSVAYGVTKDFHAAQDIAQETFLKAFNHLSELQQSERFGSWIYSIARRQSIDYIRKENTEKTTLGRVDLSASKTPMEQVEASEIQTDVWEALNKLDETNRTILVLFHFSELTLKEIGHFLQMSMSAVESRLRRARNMIKQDLMELMPNHATNRETITKQVTEQMIKQAGHFYLPVTSAEVTSEWFINHFGLSRFVDYHLILPSGQIVYLIETPNVNPKRNLPAITFTAEQGSNLRERLIEQGVRISDPDNLGEFPGQFYFYDPDGNKFAIIEKLF